MGQRGVLATVCEVTRVSDEQRTDRDVMTRLKDKVQHALNEARLKYLTELATFLTNKNDLNGKLPGTWD